MSFVTCYDAVSMVLDDAAERFGQNRKLNQETLERLQAACKLMDSIVEEIDCDSIEAEIDENTMDLIVTLCCEDLTMCYGRSHPFFKIIQHADSFGFRNGGENRLLVFFRFVGVFTHV